MFRDKYYKSRYLDLKAKLAHRQIGENVEYTTLYKDLLLQEMNTTDMPMREVTTFIDKMTPNELAGVGHKLSDIE